MDLYLWASLILLIIAAIGTVVWTVVLTKQIRIAPDLKTRSGVKGTALLTKRVSPSLLAAFLASYMFLVYSQTQSVYPVVVMFAVLVMFYMLIFRVLHEQVAAERSRASSGKSTWRGKRALRWARQSVISFGLLYILLLGMLILAAR